MTGYAADYAADGGPFLGGRGRALSVRACVCVFVGARACVVAVLRVIKRRIEWSADNEEANSDERRRSALRLSPASLASLTRWTPPSRPADRECHHVRTHAHLHKASSSFKPPIASPGDAAHLVTVSRNEDT